jgi:hypothetical protein
MVESMAIAQPLSFALIVVRLSGLFYLGVLKRRSRNL